MWKKIKTMKTSINELAKTITRVKFPLIMKCIAPDYKIGGKDCIIMFTEPNCGVVLHTNNLVHKNGEYYDNFVVCTDKSVWEPFVGTIELSND